MRHPERRWSARRRRWSACGPVAPHALRQGAARPVAEVSPMSSGVPQVALSRRDGLTRALLESAGR
jgi:hypothetical protein